ncbi:helix-turn-helix transcriptional regulator [Paenibacillus sp. RUD330]|uniref:helix-turn-helix domain-containing protein n=1 Tax=Paenibacillus sp. RUD330 TaxID=2023772 RepID=UPI000B925DB6|nr:helix-turn-helix transcriptional regulator [Paenibacillus sp. RUD330]ASS66787.1 helix-turn-helix transcriptional regulator [Paenibacillus sp. RUD330]
MSKPDHPVSAPEPAIGGRLRELRLVREWTQQQLADMLGIAKSTVSQYENNVNEPDLRMLARLCRLFGVPSDDLLGLQAAAGSFSAGFRGLTADEGAFLQASLEAYRMALKMKDGKPQRRPST